MKIRALFVQNERYPRAGALNPCSTQRNEQGFNVPPFQGGRCWRREDGFEGFSVPVVHGYMLA